MDPRDLFEPKRNKPYILLEKFQLSDSMMKPDFQKKIVFNKLIPGTLIGLFFKKESK